MSAPTPQPPAATRAPWVGIFDLFTVGIGPSSSHTVGPMSAARDFVERLGDQVADVAHLEVELYGSLAATGRGHGTLTAVMLGLEGCAPDRIRTQEVTERAERIAHEHTLVLAGRTTVPFDADRIVLSPRTVLARHSNGMRLRALGSDGVVLDEAVYFSIGGGFIVREDREPAELGRDTAGSGAESDRNLAQPGGEQPAGEGTAGTGTAEVPFPFETAAELLAICTRERLSIAEVAMRNETATRTEAEVRAGVLHIRSAMNECIAAGISAEGELPGGLQVRRRAPAWAARLRAEDTDRDPAYAQEWVNLVALAVNEENAAGGRVVTAPTNGAAGVIPAVLDYAVHYGPTAHGASRDDVAVTFLLTAAAIGALYKARASISGAEVGCQGEVGSASSMAAGGLAAVLGGTPEQVENAAEIAMEHNLGLTCDPVGGLVQIPCIERNAIAAGKAVNAAKMAMWGDGTHRVSLDQVIETMRQTGKDMSDKYKETATGGLAVNVVEC
ncbi:L-serine ammonia-lyase [Ruania alba]|uniref:L-serine dehydratase n=1 Tax=Ruania alba TaxID=648782 RepID=A0A1H5M3U7_9MICO|nr:L-serine ammonia-lyase [Ruania alba]SEE83982.1 L-serine ammonia-lyase [Ruania alba]